MEPPEPNRPTFEIELTWDEALALVNGRMFMRSMEPGIILDRFNELGDELARLMTNHAPSTRFLHTQP